MSTRWPTQATCGWSGIARHRQPAWPRHCRKPSIRDTLKLLDQVYASGEAFLAIAAPYSLQVEPADDDARVYLDFVYQPIKDADGNVSGIFVEGVGCHGTCDGGRGAS